jgi:2-amino-4-hydroxy-6-hydroxymethyldihydropteridine diphosphokinase
MPQAKLYESLASPMPNEKHALVAIGANLPFGEMQPKRTIMAAIGLFARYGLVVSKLSNLYQTPCFPAGAGPDYLNAAALVTLRQELNAANILTMLHEIEAEFGRERISRWAGRTLDLDLLALGDSVLPDLATYLHWQNLPAADQIRQTPVQLILPHPRLADRAFVLVPLNDVAADWRHPISGQTVAQMLAALPEADRAAVVPIGAD